MIDPSTRAHLRIKAERSDAHVVSIAPADLLDLLDATEDAPPPDWVIVRDTLATDRNDLAAEVERLRAIAARVSRRAAQHRQNRSADAEVRKQKNESIQR